MKLLQQLFSYDLLMSEHILKGTKPPKIKIDHWIMLSANYYKVWR